MFNNTSFASLIGCILIFAAIAEIKVVREHNVVHGAVEGLVVWGFIQYIKWNNAKQNRRSETISDRSTQEPNKEV